MTETGVRKFTGITFGSQNPSMYVTQVAVLLTVILIFNLDLWKNAKYGSILEQLPNLHVLI